MWVAVWGVGNQLHCELLVRSGGLHCSWRLDERTGASGAVAGDECERRSDELRESAGVHCAGGPRAGLVEAAGAELHGACGHRRAAGGRYSECALRSARRAVGPAAQCAEGEYRVVRSRSITWGPRIRAARALLQAIAASQTNAPQL